MKRKFINGLLMAAMVFASTSTFVSCKDYEEENYATLIEKLANEDVALKEYVDTEIGILKGWVQSNYVDLTTFNLLKDKVDDINSCECNWSDTAWMHNRIAELLSQVDDLEKKTKDLGSNASIKDDTGKDWTLIDIANKLAELTGELGGFYKVSNSEWTELQNTLNELKNRPYGEGYDDTPIKNRLSIIEDTLALWSPKLTQAFENAAYAKGLAERDSARIDALTDSLAKYTPLTQFYDSCAALRAYSDELYAKAYELVQNVNTVVNERIDLAIRDTDLKIGELRDEFQAADSVLQDQIDSLVADVADLTEKLENLTTRVDQIEDAFKKQVTGIIIQETYNPAVGSFVTPLGVELNTLVAYYGKAEQAFDFPAFETGKFITDWSAADKADLLQSIQALGDIQGSISKVKDQILLGDEGNAGTLYLTVNPNTVDFTGKMVTLENSQAQVAPVTLSPLEKTDHVKTVGWTRAADNGFYAAKATISAEDIKSGKTTARVDFSNSKDAIKAIYNNPSRATIKAGLKSFAKDLFTQSSDILDANAVKATYTTNLNGEEQTHSVYSEYKVAVFTVNPLSFNTGVGINVSRIPGVDRVENLIGTLINRVNVEGIINIGELPNLDLSGLNINITLDTTKIENYKIEYHLTIPAKEFSFEGKSISVKDTLHTYLAASDETTTGFYYDENGTFVDAETGDKYSYGYVPMGDRIYYQYTTPAGKVYYPMLTGVAYLSEDGTGINFTIEDQTFTTDEYNVDIDKTVNLRKMIQEISDQISASTTDVNTKLADLSNYVNKINDMLVEVRNINNKISDVKDDAKNLILSYIDKANDRLAGYINQFNRAMQPVAFVEAADGLHRLSQAQSLPSHLKSANLQLYPTTWNAEIVSPAYKKFVAVTKAIKAGANDQNEVSAINSSNDLLKVFDGAGKTNVNINGLKAGYIYEIAYLAVDFHGVIAARKYYVTVD